MEREGTSIVNTGQGSKSLTRITEGRETNLCVHDFTKLLEGSHHARGTKEVTLNWTYMTPPLKKQEQKNSSPKKKSFNGLGAIENQGYGIGLW